MKLVRSWGPAVLWMGIIFYLSGRQSIEVSPDQLINFIFFKFLHVVEYAVLYIAFYRALRGASPRALLGAFILTLLYAASDELHQTLVPTREGKVRDVIIDGLGSVVGWITITKVLPKMPKKLRKLAGNWLSI